MVDRCRICGSHVSNVTICNYCRTAYEEKRFFKMVTKEELREASALKNMKSSDLPKRAAH